MKASVNRDPGQANATCVRTCPGVFRLDEDERWTVLMGPLSEDLRPALEDAVGSCPRQTLGLET